MIAKEALRLAVKSELATRRGAVLAVASGVPLYLLERFVLSGELKEHDQAALERWCRNGGYAR